MDVQTLLPLKERGFVVPETAGVGRTDHALWRPKSMSTSSGESTESSDHECPTCGDTFASDQGVKAHHKRIHGESIAGETVNCSYCGEPKTVLPYKAREQKMWFCDKDCEGSYYAENLAGENSHNWEGGEISATCGNCGDDFTVCRAEYERSEEHYCDVECMAEGYVGRFVGEDHPNWCGGHYKYYGESWYRQRRNALERDDYECVICGRGEGDLHRAPDVHHITPFRKYGRENHEEANRLDNLVTLCHEHHSKWEGIPLRPHLAD